MSNNLQGRRALVTGGTRGIGAAIVARLLKEGADVIVTGTQPHFSPAKNSTYVAIDFSDPLATKNFAQRISKEEISILINNAGINKVGPYTEIPLEDFDLIQRVNIRAPFLLCQAVIPYMKDKRWGRIVNISSIFGKVSKEFRASYSTSKFGLDGMTAALAAEVASDGILANCVAPGFIDTDMTRNILGEKGIAELIQKIPAKRLGRVEEIAAFVTWLAGCENTYISGQNIAIDGGFTRV